MQEEVLRRACDVGTTNGRSQARGFIGLCLQLSE
jgi:hypothetical protein